jgi:ribonuclease III
VTAQLLERHPNATEGDLAWMRQQVVGRDTCAEVARGLGLPGRFARAAPARHRETARGMSEQTSVQAALVEALIGACWLDLGAEATDAAVVQAFESAISRATPGRRDPKTALQEEAARRRVPLRYELVATEGPPHARTFTTRALVGDRELGRGSGASKQASEQAAAAVAMDALQEERG